MKTTHVLVALNIILVLTGTLQWHLGEVRPLSFPCRLSPAGHAVRTNRAGPTSVSPALTES